MVNCRGSLLRSSWCALSSNMSCTGLLPVGVLYVVRPFLRVWSTDSPLVDTPPKKQARADRRRFIRPGGEQLEPRLMLDIGLPQVLVAGRTLSAYSVADIQNNELQITYTVYNEQSSPVIDVRLTDTLAAGVTFKDATQPPDRSGQELAWSFGTIEGYDRASVTLTVSLRPPRPSHSTRVRRRLGHSMPTRSPTTHRRPRSVAHRLSPRARFDTRRQYHGSLRSKKRPNWTTTP